MEFREYKPLEQTEEFQEPVADMCEEMPAYLQGLRNSAFYSMVSKHQGIALIINNKTFQKRTNLKPRTNSEADVQELTNCFRNIGLITLVYEDQTTKEITKIVKTLGKQNHVDHDCLFICILSYGNMTYTYATDGRFRNDELFAPFRGHRCPTLAGKPKVFLLQMFSIEERHKPSNSTKVDCYNQNRQNLPIHADILIAYNEIPETIPWKLNEVIGSPYVQEMCRLIKKEATSNDLLSILTTCNFNVLQMLDKMTLLQAEKHVTCTTSTLTRKIVFRITNQT